ncbi:MAG: hypothetical protein ACRD92_04400 [Nitrosopumilaceae archaeon]
MNSLIIAIIVVIGLLTALILSIIYTAPPEALSLDYDDIGYDELATRPVNAVVFVAIQNIPERNCFTFDDVFFMPALKAAMQQAKEYAWGSDPTVEPDQVYTGMGFDITTRDAIELISEHNFEVTKTITDRNIKKIPDPHYQFKCFFEYQGDQYMLDIDFNTHYYSDSNIVNVNFTRDVNRNPVVENQNIVVYAGGFNGTVVFANNLGHDITMTNVGLGAISMEWDVTIPNGKIWSYNFRNFNGVDSTTYTYLIKPDNLTGTITAKGYPRCMTESEAYSLYSQVGADIHFPSYLPDGYSFECAVHNHNAYLIYTYWNDEQRAKFADKANDGIGNEFLVNGGIRIDYMNDYILNGWTVDPRYDKTEYAKIYGAYPDNTVTYVDGNPVVLSKEYFWYEGSGKQINSLYLFLDDDLKYRIRSSLPHEELVKVAESLY